LQHAWGFAKVCGRDDTAISEENVATLKTSDGDPKLLYEAMNAALADRRTCIAYLNGIIDGWQSGHEHGVDVMVFPKGIPVADHYAEALKTLSLEQLRAAQAGMSADPICMPNMSLWAKRWVWSRSTFKTKFARINLWEWPQLPVWSIPP
jgi:hypothetical protein